MSIFGKDHYIKFCITKFQGHFLKKKHNLSGPTLGLIACCPILFTVIRTVINRVSVIACRQGSNCTLSLTTCNYRLDDRTFE